MLSWSVIVLTQSFRPVLHLKYNAFTPHRTLTVEFKSSWTNNLIRILSRHLETFHSVDMWQAAANALRPLRPVHYILPPTVGRPHCIWDYCNAQPRYYWQLDYYSKSSDIVLWMILNALLTGNWQIVNAMPKRVKCLCSFLDYTPCYVSRDGKRIETTVRKAGRDIIIIIIVHHHHRQSRSLLAIAFLRRLCRFCHPVFTPLASATPNLEEQVCVFMSPSDRAGLENRI